MAAPRVFPAFVRTSLLALAWVRAVAAGNVKVTHVDVLVNNLDFEELEHTDVGRLSKSVAWSFAETFGVNANEVTDLGGGAGHVYVAEGAMLMPWSKTTWPVANGPGGKTTFFSAALHLPDDVSEAEVEQTLKSASFQHTFVEEIKRTLGGAAAVSDPVTVKATQAAVAEEAAPQRKEEPVTEAPSSAAPSPAATQQPPVAARTTQSPRAELMAHEASEKEVVEAKATTSLRATAARASSEVAKESAPLPPAPSPEEASSVVAKETDAAQKETPSAEEDGQKGQSMLQWAIMGAGGVFCTVCLACGLCELRRRHRMNLSKLQFSREDTSIGSTSPHNMSGKEQTKGGVLAKASGLVTKWAESRNRPLGYTGP